MEQLPRLSNIDLTLNNGVAMLSYNRPKNANALNVPFMQDLLLGLNWAEQDDRVRVILQTGQGPIFTAGLDLNDESVVKKDTAISDEFIEVLSDVHRAMITSNKVLVTAVNGVAPGWGTSSLGLADLVFAVPHALFFTPFVRLGICPEACSSVTFTRIMGHVRAARLLLAGDQMTAVELEQAGFVSKVIHDKEFLHAVVKTCEQIAGQPSEALVASKTLLRRVEREELLRTNDVELVMLRQRARSSEALTAVARFKQQQEQKRKRKQKVASNL